MSMPILIKKEPTLFLLLITFVSKFTTKKVINVPAKTVPAKADGLLVQITDVLQNALPTNKNMIPKMNNIFFISSLSQFFLHAPKMLKMVFSVKKLRSSELFNQITIRKFFKNHFSIFNL